MRKRNPNIAMGTLLAAGLGYMAGILMAPKSGRETRRDIERSALQAKREAEKALKALNSELTDLIAQSKLQARQLKGVARKEFDQALSEADSARAKVREIISALHEGESENHDLQAAMKDVDRSLEHLKKYIKS